MSARARALRTIAALVLACHAPSLWAQVPSAYEAGVAARLDDRPQDASRLLQAWLAEHPGDVDAQLQLAYADLALGRLDAAEAGFRAVLAAAPDYRDASEGLLLIARRRAAAPGTYASVEGALSDLSGGRTDWREVALALQGPIAASTTAEGRATWYDRFGRRDVEIGALVTRHVGADLWLRAGAGVTPHAHFRPQVSLTGGFDWRLTRGDKATVLTADARYEEFPAQQVVTLSPGLVHYLAGDRAWLTARAFGVIPEGQKLRVGYLVRADVQPTESYRLFAGLAQGPDTDLGVVTDTTSLFGGIELPLGTRFAVTGALAREWREDDADRTDFRIGLKARL